MSDILSQQEIDLLLQSLNTGDADLDPETEESASKVRVYDFRTANRISRDQMKTLNFIYDNFSRLLSNYLTATLGIGCDVSVSSAEERSYFEFTNSVAAGSVMAILKMAPLQGSVLLQVSPEVAYTILQGLLGGVDVPAAQRRTFTEIDLVIIEKIIRQFLPLNNEAWDKIVSVRSQLEGIETNIQFAQIAPPAETIAIITLGVHIGEEDSYMNLCIPHSALEPVAKALNSRLLVAGRGESGDGAPYQDPILNKLHPTPIPLKAILSETTLTVKEVTGLQPGDVIQLDNQIGDLIQINIGHLPRLCGQMGTQNKRYAIRVTGFIYEEEEEHE